MVHILMTFRLLAEGVSLWLRLKLKVFCSHLTFSSSEQVITNDLMSYFDCLDLSLRSEVP